MGNQMMGNQMGGNMMGNQMMGNNMMGNQMGGNMMWNNQMGMRPNGGLQKIIHQIITSLMVSLVSFVTHME